MDDMPSKEELIKMGKQCEKDADEEWLYWQENPLSPEELSIIEG